MEDVSSHLSSFILNLDSSHLSNMTYASIKLWFTTIFYVGFIPWQKVLYLHYFVPCILWDFIVLDLVLSWWRIEHETKISAILRLTCKKLSSKVTCKKVMWEAHAGSWRVKCQASFCKYFTRQVISRGTHETFCLEDFKCNFLNLHPYYIYSHYPQKHERPFREKKP